MDGQRSPQRAVGQSEPQTGIAKKFDEQRLGIDMQPFPAGVSQDKNLPIVRLVGCQGVYSVVSFIIMDSRRNNYQVAKNE